MPSWERRPGESPRAFAAFGFYLQLGPSRSVDKAYQLYLQLNPPQKGTGEKEQEGGGTVARGKKRAPSHWQAWSSENEWVRRAHEHDAAERAQLAREAQEDQRHRMEAYRQACVETGAETMQLARTLSAIAAAEARVYVQSLKDYERAFREAGSGKKPKRPRIPQGLSSLARAAAHVSMAAQATQAQALGVEDLMEMLDNAT